jgi:hypothetical protein
VLEAEQGARQRRGVRAPDRDLLSKQGSTAALAQQCETVSAWHRGNDLSLLWPIHAKHRILLFPAAREQTGGFA